MWISKPGYYDAFRCIASACPDSCCKEWEVQVDDTSAARYLALSGPLGDRLRQVLRHDDDGYTMTISDGRCPMWRQDGLCAIQAQLGEEGLCQVCRDFPRLRHDYGDFLELGLELSCPEAARLIFSTSPAPMVCCKLPGGEKAEYDREAMTVLKHTREQALQLLEREDYTPGQRLALLLIFGCEAQESLDGGEEAAFDPESALELGRSLAAPGDIAAISGFFRTLELLTPGWPLLLERCRKAPAAPDTMAMARYLIQRYWLQAVSDYDLICRVKFMVISCLLVSALPGSFPENAQCFSKEIENNIDNLEAVLDAAYTHPAFTDSSLLGLLLG